MNIINAVLVGEYHQIEIVQELSRRVSMWELGFTSVPLALSFMPNTVFFRYFMFPSCHREIIQYHDSSVLKNGSLKLSGLDRGIILCKHNEGEMTLVEAMNKIIAENDEILFTDLPIKINQLLVSRGQVPCLTYHSFAYNFIMRRIG